MKIITLVLVLFSTYFSFPRDTYKVLIFVKEESSQLDYMLAHEVNKMVEILKDSDIEIATATISGKELNAGSTTFIPDLKLQQVNIDDYDGFLIPCMVVDTVTVETINFVKKIKEKNKPIAAQVASVYLLAHAGLLEGKKYALYSDQSDNPEFDGSLYDGNGVVKDGNIVTSGGCPWMEYNNRGKDRTEELTQSFIDVIINKQ